MSDILFVWMAQSKPPIPAGGKRFRRENPVARCLQLSPSRGYRDFCETKARPERYI
jgi:hypothetical protein